MKDYVTIASFTYPSDLYVIRSRLEAEGIDTYLKDEWIVNVHNFYSLAVGGIKLQVSEADKEMAIAILKEEGYLKDRDFLPNPFWVKLKNWTASIPFLKKVRFELRFIMIAVILSAIPLIPTILLLMPEVKLNLTGNAWCLQYVSYKGQQYGPRTTGLTLIGNDDCTEILLFRETGRFNMPGFYTGRFNGRWERPDKYRLKITNVDTFEHIFEGSYEIDVTDQGFVLYSDDTEIHCRKTRSFFF